MKGHRPRLSADPATTRALYVRLRELTHRRIDAYLQQASPPFSSRARYLVSRAAFEQLRTQGSPAPAGGLAGIAGGGLAGVEVVVVDWLPRYEKKARPCIEKRREAKREAARAAAAAAREAEHKRAMQEMNRSMEYVAAILRRD